MPLTSWFRFRRAVEPTATVLLVVEREPCARTCASLVVRLQRTAVCVRDAAPVSETAPYGWKVLGREAASVPPVNGVSHAALLGGLRLRAEVLRAGAQRKPVQLADAGFELRAAW